MRAFSSFAFAAGVLGVNALNLVQREDGLPPRAVKYDIQRRHVENPVQRDRERMRKRATDSTVQVPLLNEETLYFMDATIGTPAQSFRLHIDTGSSDLWVNVASSQFCQSERGSSSMSCTVSGTYSANSSSTYKYVNSDFNITYVDGTGSSGDYVTDTVAFEGITLQNQQFGIGYVSSSSQSILGIGYPTNEVAVAYRNDQPYANVPQHMVNDGIISTNAYSLWLNDLDASTGSILFGGVDTASYSGELQTLPIIPEQGGYAEFIIALTAVGANGTSGSIANNIAVPALLDSGSSLMYLPDDICSTIFSSLGAQYSSSDGVAIVDCGYQNSNVTIDFTFSSPTIRVPLNELVIPMGTTRRGQEVCILGISYAGSSTPVLGDTFLRSAYVVYDLENNEVSLAQTNFTSTKTSNVMEISKSSGIPGASTVPNAVTSVAVSQGNGRINGQPSSIFGANAAPTMAPARNLAMLGVAAGGLLMAI